MRKNDSNDQIRSSGSKIKIPACFQLQHVALMAAGVRLELTLFRVNSAMLSPGVLTGITLVVSLFGYS